MQATLGVTSAICLILAFTATSVSSFTCPPIGSNETAYYPHETTCSLFYQCDNGIAVLQECGPEQHFNPEPKISACDWWWNLNPLCQDARALREPQCPPGPSDPEAETIYFPHETDCAKYYMCSNGVAIERPCSEGLHWNQKEKVCDHPWAIVPPCRN